MLEFAGRAVTDWQGVDDITRERIKKITGDIDDEMKMHRKAIWALSVLSFPHLHPAHAFQEAQDVAQRASSVNDEIEAVIAEGKAFKAANGLI